MKAAKDLENIASQEHDFKCSVIKTCIEEHYRNSVNRLFQEVLRSDLISDSTKFKEGFESYLEKIGCDINNNVIITLVEGLERFNYVAKRGKNYYFTQKGFEFLIQICNSLYYYETHNNSINKEDELLFEKS